MGSNSFRTLILCLSCFTLYSSTENRQSLVDAGIQSQLDKLHTEAMDGDEVSSMAYTLLKDASVKDYPRFIHRYDVKMRLVTSGLARHDGEGLAFGPDIIELVLLHGMNRAGTDEGTLNEK